MSDDHNDDNVVNLGSARWYKAEALAQKLEVSVRTVYNRLQRGEVEKKETPEGVRYRVKPDEEPEGPEDHELQAEIAEQHSSEALPSSKLLKGEGLVHQLLQLVQSLQDDLKDAQFAHGRLSAVEEHMVELKAENQALRGAKARLHVAEGRRELAEERLHQKNRELEHAKDEIERLRRQLEQAERSAGSTWSIFS